MKIFYSSKPDGLIGNEDCGQMSAWYVMSSLGLYSVTPGSDVYALTEPYFQDYTVQLESEKTFNKNISERLRHHDLARVFVPIIHKSLISFKQNENISRAA